MKKLFLGALIGAFVAGCQGPLATSDYWYPNTNTRIDLQDRDRAFWKCHEYVANFPFQLSNPSAAGMRDGSRMKYCMNKEGYEYLPPR